MTKPIQFLVSQSEGGVTHADVMLETATLWLGQKQLTERFGKAKRTISEHIFEDGKLVSDFSACSLAGLAHLNPEASWKTRG